MWSYERHSLKVSQVLLELNRTHAANTLYTVELGVTGQLPKFSRSRANSSTNVGSEKLQNATKHQGNIQSAPVEFEHDAIRRNVHRQTRGISTLSEAISVSLAAGVIDAIESKRLQGVRKKENVAKHENFRHRSEQQ